MNVTYNEKSGMYILEGSGSPIVLTRKEAAEIYRACEKEYFKDDLYSVLSQDYKMKDEQINGILADTNLIDKLFSEYQEKQENHDEWRYDLQDAINELVPDEMLTIVSANKSQSTIEHG